jgi:hypothetical protein
VAGADVPGGDPGQRRDDERPELDRVHPPRRVLSRHRRPVGHVEGIRHLHHVTTGAGERSAHAEA